MRSKWWSWALDATPRITSQPTKQLFLRVRFANAIDFAELRKAELELRSNLRSTIGFAELPILARRGRLCTRTLTFSRLLGTNPA
ncbi:MAG: hypothetical protein WA977_08745 [Halobacteriota archaeon]